MYEVAAITPFGPHRMAIVDTEHEAIVRRDELQPRFTTRIFVREASTLTRANAVVDAATRLAELVKTGADSPTLVAAIRTLDVKVDDLGDHIL